MKPQPLDLDELADSIIRVWYPSYEQTSIPQLKNAINRKKHYIKEILKKRLKSACEFWLRYKDDPVLFWKEQAKYRNIFKEEFGVVIINGEPIKPIFDYLPKFNEWLFKLAFKGVV